MGDAAGCELTYSWPSVGRGGRNDRLGSGLNNMTIVKAILLAATSSLAATTAQTAQIIMDKVDSKDTAVYMYILGDIEKDNGEHFLGATDDHIFVDVSRGRRVFIVLES